MFQNIGFTELLLIAIVALVIFGPQKLPEIGRVLGRTIRDFKKGANALLNDEQETPAELKPAATAAPIIPAQQAQAPQGSSAVEFASSTPAVVENDVSPAPPAAAPIAPSSTRRLPD